MLSVKELHMRYSRYLVNWTLECYVTVSMVSVSFTFSAQTEVSKLPDSFQHPCLGIYTFVSNIYKLHFVQLSQLIQLGGKAHTSCNFANITLFFLVASSPISFSV